MYQIRTSISFTVALVNHYIVFDCANVFRCSRNIILEQIKLDRLENGA